ncbi:type II inositol 3,4-bisphosphate 4-phosphatase-like isoform X1 [Micropterus dolomieu]|uniref:type II inositol 3,4-bisphosphate 4-phosphatase-like isoform X1 n=1 Tax=Micropterus dolomieu TaxID=147949 RepID=UPI001E8E63DE|nr:type II inositol 3,4-bisphosphate 4-phosphatase-like isoform X1 [Micropterus dolomieu]
MRMNHSQLLFLSREETSGNFQKEGTLRVGRQERALTDRFCRLRGNLLFVLKTQGGKLEEVLLLERCEVMKLPDHDRRLAVSFESGDPPVFLESSSTAECVSWLVLLRDANTETLRRRIAQLCTLISTHTATTLHTQEHSAHFTGGGDAGGTGGVEAAAKVSPLHLTVECRVVVSVAARVQLQVCVIDTRTHTVRKHCCCQIVEGLDDSVFLTSVCFCGDYPLYHHSRIKLTVSHAEEPTAHATRSFLGFTSFSIRDLLKSKEPHVSLSLRTMDGVNEVGEVKVSRLQMEGESEDKTPPEHKCPALCDSLHSSVHEKENSPMMRAVLCAQVCKVYRFQTEDQRWLLVREQMSETPLSFSLPKQLLSMLINEHTSRVQEVKELGDLSPHWDGVRHDVINHCNHLIGCYQETLTELDKLSASSCFKSSSSKSEKHLRFIPTNLHSQRMEVTSPDSTGVWYEFITFGAPADHHQAFKHGGLKRLLSKRTNHSGSSVSYSQDESCRARELLASVAQLLPLVFGLAEELLSVSLELNAARLQQVLDSLTQQTDLFVHALKDELVKSALLAIHTQRSTDSSHVHSNGLLCDNTPANQERQTSLRDAEYDEEEWDRAWANVAMILSCIIAMGDRLQGREDRPQEVTSSEQQDATGDTNCQNTASSSSSSSSSASSWQEQLLPLVVTLRDCVREAVGKARDAMTFVVLQGAVARTVAQGSAQLVHRRHAVFSQALSAVVCGFMLKLYGGLEDPEFLHQLHSVGVLAQFEGLLSTYGDEVGMLEDMEVGVADLSGVTFTITEAKTEQPDDLLPTLSGGWGSLVVEVPLPPETFGSLPRELKEGRLIRLHPVLFNIGINQQQSLAERFGDSSLQERVNQQSCERLKTYCNTLRDRQPDTAGLQSLSDLLSSLDHSVETRKRKNVEVLWIAAAVCRTVNGVRLTSCKSAKDRTAMSVTLEQCALLRERHTLSQQHFSTALDCMRRDGCRMENVQKNVGCRKFAFSGVQLLTFPKLYRPPDGSYG